MRARPCGTERLLRTLCYAVPRVRLAHSYLGKVYNAYFFTHWLVAHGCLIDERPNGGEKYLLYIITTFVGGTPIKDIAKELTREDEITLAQDLGLLLGRLHRLKPNPEQMEEASLEWKKFISKR